MAMDRRTALASLGAGMAAFAGCGGFTGGDADPATTPADAAETTTEAPASTTTAPATTAPPPERETWPQYQRDAARAGTAAGPGPTGDGPQWTAGTSGAVVDTPVVGEEAVAASTGSTLYGFERGTGAQAWTYEPGSPTVGPPALLGGTAVAAVDGSALEFVDLASGDRTRRVGLPSRPVTGPAVAAGSVYVACENGRVYALTPGGAERWHSVSFNEDDFPRLAVGPTNVYVATDLGLYAHGVEKGYRAWSVSGDSIRVAPAVAGGRVFATTIRSWVGAFDPASGEELWRTTLDGGNRPSPAATADAVFFVSGATLFRLRAASGGVEWTAPIGSPTESAPVVADNAVYVTGGDDRVRAFDRADGTRLWTTHLEGASDTTAALADGTLYVGGNRHVRAHARTET